MKEKRLFDIFCAIIGTVLFCPVFVLSGLLIFLEDFGDIFFFQKRVGYNKQSFQIIKFRTMNNGRITKTGRWLRATGLDEIPQFFNVLKSEMSIIGPRPLTKEDIVRMGWDSCDYNIRWSCKPGITGISQLFGGHDAHTSWTLDMQYIMKHSIITDTWIIVLSFAVNLFGKHSVRRFFKNRI